MYIGLTNYKKSSQINRSKPVTDKVNVPFKSLLLPRHLGGGYSSWVLREAAISLIQGTISVPVMDTKA